MRLFEIDETHNVRPNKAWIALIPEFNALLKRDKGMPTTEGRVKKRARKDLAYIYFWCDFGSPIRDLEPTFKKKEALYYAGLTEEEVNSDTVLQTAIKKYQELQNANARSLRSFHAISKGLDQLDTYMEKVDFSETDKKGEMVHDPNKFAALIERMTIVYQKRRDFEKFVEDDLKANAESIQGNRTLGDREGDNSIRKTAWSESDIMLGSQHTSGASTGTSGRKTFEDMQKTIHEGSKVSEFSEDEIESMEVFGEDDEK
jgi:hypothetical protein